MKYQEQSTRFKEQNNEYKPKIKTSIGKKQIDLHSSVVPKWAQPISTGEAFL